MSTVDGLLVALIAVSTQARESVCETLSNGVVVEREVVAGTDGKPLNDGNYRQWWPESEGGGRKVQGRYKEGLRHGRWLEWFPDGKPAVKGQYNLGLRRRDWVVFDSNSTEVANDSGYFRIEDIAIGERFRARGEMREGVRHGEWHYFWANGSPQVLCRFVEGELQGPLLFAHRDGTVDLGWISGLYADGVRKGPLSTEVANRLTETFRALVGAADQELTDEAAHLLKALRAECGLPSIERHAERRLFELPLNGELLATVLGAMEINRTDDSRIATWLIRERLLQRSHSAFDWTEGERPESLENLVLSEGSLRRWTSLLSLDRQDPYSLDIPLRRLELAESGKILWLDDYHRLPGHLMITMTPYPSRFEPRKGAVAEAVAQGLDWLVRHQEPDGSWNPATFSTRCDTDEACDGQVDKEQELRGTGITGLALLALMANEQTAPNGQHRQAAAAGLVHLVRGQKSDGLLGPGAYEHAIATLALAEGLVLFGAPGLRTALERAVAYIERARNPYSAWRYSSPPIGDNDTSVTTWMVSALWAARMAGVEYDHEADYGALAWYDEVTDPNTGRCGYTEIGAPSSRVVRVNDLYPADETETLTAAALFGRYLLGQRPDDTAILERHAELMLRALPVWDSDGLTVDHYYWFYGSHAAYQHGGREWALWKKALEPALLYSQSKDGHRTGSWDPIGPWGWAGGRIYSTAMAVLALSCEWRIARLTELDED